MKTKKKKPTVKDISFRMQMLEELLEGLQKFMLEPLARSIDVLALTLNEYIEMKDDGDNLVNHLKDKAKNEKSKDLLQQLIDINFNEPAIFAHMSNIYNEEEVKDLGIE